MVKRYFSNETKPEKFKRLASFRTNAVIEKLRILGNCSNTSIYDYSEEDVRKMFGAITAEVQRVRLLFAGSKRKKKFNLD